MNRIFTAITILFTVMLMQVSQKPLPGVDLVNNWTNSNTFTQQIVSTVATGTAPFSIASTTVVPNLNASKLGGFNPPSSAIVGLSDTQTLTNKTLISPALNGTATGTANFLPVTLFNSGTGASSSTFWRGDGTWAAPQATLLAYSVTTESANTTSLTASSFTMLITKSVTMPSSGCPCRVDVRYSQYLNPTGSSSITDMLVSDGSNTMAEVETTLNVNQGGMNGSGYSPGTYANSANVTFTLQIKPSVSGVNALAASNQTGVRNSRLEISIIPSN